MGAYFYAIFSMIAAGIFLPTLDTKTIMVFAQSALLFIQVTFQGKYRIILPRMLCNRNGAISQLQTEMGFVEDFRYSLQN